MARWISGGDATDVAAELDQALKSGQLKRVPFNTKTPVHITYMTVTSGDDGKLSFWRDIYHREKATEQATDVARPYEPVEPAETEANQAIASVDKGRVQTVAYYDPQRAG